MSKSSTAKMFEWLTSQDTEVIVNYFLQVDKSEGPVACTQLKQDFFKYMAKKNELLESSVQDIIKQDRINAENDNSLVDAAEAALLLATTSGSELLNQVPVLQDALPDELKTLADVNVIIGEKPRKPNILTSEKEGDINFLA